MSERQEKKRRRILRWEYERALYKWKISEPCKLFFWRWIKWKKSKPILKEREKG